MPVFICTNCPGTKCTTIVDGEEDCADPDQCLWKGGNNLPVWRRLEVAP